MTALFTRCPFCKSNFMLLDSETGSAECVVCGKEHGFSEQEVSDAESRRDKLAESYMGRMTAAFEAKDYEGMAKIAEEVAKEGVSSWYAWMCIGWSDIHEGKTGSAFDDFKLAVSFLDEENFDEFYESVMDFVLDSMLEAAKNDKDWNDENTTLVEYTGALSERFEDIMEDDFVCDLLLRIGMMVDDIDCVNTGARLINEIAMVVLDYLSGNTFVMDHQCALRNACVSVETLDEKVQSFGNDGTFPMTISKFLGKEYISFMGILIEMGDKLEFEYSEDDLLSLCFYWTYNEYDEVFDHVQDAFSFHLDFIKSSGRNKGVMKKRDRALVEYEEAYKAPLLDGRALEEYEFEENGEDFDAICPDCGKPLKVDDSGLMVCECGFKSRAITGDIESLPDKIPELMAMGRKAYAQKDSAMLNNIGEKVSAIDENHWYGYLAIAQSCLLDGELGEAIMLIAQSAETVPVKESKEFHDIVVEELGSAFSELDDENNLSAILVLPMFFTSVAMGGAKDTRIPEDIVVRMMKGTYNTSGRGYVATTIVPPVLKAVLLNETSLTRQREVCQSLSSLMDVVESSMDSIKRDEVGLKGDVLNIARTNRSLLGLMIEGIEKKSEELGIEKIGYLAGCWSSDKEGYGDLVGELMVAFAFDDDAVYSSNSKAILKSKHAIKTYLDAYINVNRN